MSARQRDSTACDTHAPESFFYSVYYKCSACGLDAKKGSSISPNSLAVGSLSCIYNLAAWCLPIEGNGAVRAVVEARDAVVMRPDVQIPRGGSELRVARVRVSAARVAAMPRPVGHLPAKEGGVARAARPQSSDAVGEVAG